MVSKDTSLMIAGISETLKSISEAFRSLADDVESFRASNVADCSEPTARPLMEREASETDHLSIAKSIYRARRQRDKIFDGLDLFHDPAWDMVLDLYIARSEGRRISVTSASLASQAPSTTALRWLDMLQRSGIVNRVKDDRDARRNFVELSDRGMVLMASVLDNYQRVWSPQTSPA